MTIRLAVVARTDVGRVRKANEDAFLVADMAVGAKVVDREVARFAVGDRGALLAVADGMGGHKAGDVASAMTLSSLHAALVERTSAIDANTRVKTAVERANRDVFEAGVGTAGKKMGATLTAVLIDGGTTPTAHIAEIGDSRAYLIRNGVIKQVTHDQSYAQIMIDAGALSAEEVNSSPMKNVLLQAIGQTPDVKVALASLALRQRDCLLICSDGLWGKISADELRAAVLSSSTLDGAADRLVALANERGGDDNITVLLAGVSGDLLPVGPEERISDTFQVLATFDAPATPAGAGGSSRPKAGPDGR